MPFRSRIIFSLTLVTLIGIGFLAPTGVRAGPCIWGLGWLCDSFAGAIFGIIWILGYAFGYLIAVFGSLLEYLIKTGNVGRTEAVKAAWVAVRDLANLFFGLGMVAIALATIFRLEGYGWKRALPRLIIAALLINFSFVIAGTIIDIGNIFSFFFLNQFTTALGPQIANALGVGGFLDLRKTPPSLQGTAIGAVGPPVALILTVVLMAVTAITFGVGIVFLAVRIFMLWLLIILSPIIWIAWVFPGTESYWKKWWETFLKWVFFAPIYIFMIWLALFIITSKQAITQIITSEVNANQGLQAIENQSNNLLTTGTGPEAIMQFGFMTMMMFGAIYVAQMGGMYGAQVGMKLAQGVPKGLSKLGLRAADRWLARGAHGPRVLPRISKFAQKHGWDKVAKWTEKTIGEKITSRLGEQWKKKYGETGAEERLKKMDWWRRTIPTLASPAAMKRAYAAISARTDEVSYAGAGGRLQDAWYSTVPWEWRETGYEEREIEQLEHGMSKEIETSTTEEQLSGDINELFEKARAGDKQAQATLIAALDKDAPLNGLNTMIANLPKEFKDAMQENAKEIARTTKEETRHLVGVTQDEARAERALAATAHADAVAARTRGDTETADDYDARERDANARAVTLDKQAAEMRTLSDDGGEIDKQIKIMDRGNVHQGFFLRAFLQETLGDTARAGRVANDLAVNARQAGNHSLSGISKFDTETGEFGWNNNYYSIKTETAGQFKKGQPQLNMRMFHPDFFMRDQQGRLTSNMSTHGLGIVSQGITFNHVREIHQMRPETSENFTNNLESIRDQFTDPNDKATITQMVTNILHHKQQLGEFGGQYRLDERVVGRVEDPPGSGRFVNVEEWWMQKEDPPGSGTYRDLEQVPH